jgi:hypothetical protein
MSLIFRPDKHEYISLDNPDLKWTSVTSFISKFKQPFDADTIARKVCKSKKSKWYGMSVEDILKAWKAESDRATTLGTWYHNQREADLCSLSTINREGMDVSIFSPLLDNDGSKTAPDQKLTEGIYPEHMVFLKSVGLCGQSDYVEVVNKKVNIIDYKTNKEIKKESFKSFDGRSQKMSAPVSHLDDCNFNHYALQLSLYMYMIIKHNPLYKPGKMSLHHVIFEEVDKDKWGNPIAARDTNGDPIVQDIVQYDLPYLKTEITELIKWKMSQQS